MRNSCKLSSRRSGSTAVIWAEGLRVCLTYTSTHPLFYAVDLIYGMWSALRLGGRSTALCGARQVRSLPSRVQRPDGYAVPMEIQ